jgi:hypothetical protein
MEADGLDVTTVETRAGDDGFGGTFVLELQLFPDELGTGDGSLTVEDVTVRDAGTASLDVSVELTGSDAGCATAETGQPAYKDPDRLRDVYETHDTFPAMKEALGADVTPKTVRNHMVKHGIHEPESDGSESAAEDDAGTAEPSNPRQNAASYEESESTEGQLMSDGRGLPRGIDLADVKAGVQAATTPTEFGRRLDLDHAQARRVLENLNLMDYVYDRVDTGPTSDVPMAEIESSIRSAVGEAPQ